MNHNWWKIPLMIEDRARKKKQIIYGARAMNRQVPLFFQRETEDYDILTRLPKSEADRMQKNLDKEVAMGKDEFYYTRALHPGTYKVRHIGEDRKKGTRDDINIVDYTQMPRKKVPVRVHGGVRYESTTSIEKTKRKILKDPKSEYRHEKDRADIERIGYTKVFRKRW